MKTQPDFKDKNGKWVQRSHIGEKYVWTVSGVLWNNVKERCNPNGHTQKREPTYRGASNQFEDFQKFAEWNRQQKGYAMGYQLDADILLNGNKIYSPDTCLLIPAKLNKFLQTCAAKRGPWPQGMYQDGKRLVVRIADTILATLPINRDSIDVGRALYKAAKEARAREWAIDLQRGEYEVDQRVIDYLNNYAHVCDWRGNEHFSI